MTQTTISREEHLKWCKRRALEYADLGEGEQALASMTSDLNKHPATQGHPAVQLGLMLLMQGHLETPQQIREFIEGFN